LTEIKLSTGIIEKLKEINNKKNIFYFFLFIEKKKNLSILIKLIFAKKKKKYRFIDSKRQKILKKN
jgi:Ni,Fe-hydrogenase III component G